MTTGTTTSHDDSSGHGGDDIDEDDIAAQTALAQPVGEREIRFVDERVTPNTITIQVGETVTFVNADDDEHTATGPGFDTGKMNPGDSVTITFDTPGSFDFVCQFHPEMRGTVIVEGTGTPEASPVASPVANATTTTAVAGRGGDDRNQHRRFRVRAGRYHRCARERRLPGRTMGSRRIR